MSNREQEIEKAVEHVMNEIDSNRLSSTDVPQADTIEFLKQIESSCRERRETIRAEMEG